MLIVACTGPSPFDDDERSDEDAEADDEAEGADEEEEEDGGFVSENRARLVGAAPPTPDELDELPDR